MSYFSARYCCVISVQDTVVLFQCKILLLFQCKVLLSYFSARYCCLIVTTIEMSTECHNKKFQFLTYGKSPDINIVHYLYFYVMFRSI